MTCVSHTAQAPTTDPLDALARNVTSVTVTAASVNRSFLTPSMHAIALSARQELLAYNPTRERDSLLEWACWLRPREPEAAAALLGLTRRFVRIEHREREHVRAIAGAADELTTDLRAMELRGQGFPLTGKRIAALLREPLDVLADPPSARGSYVRAVRQVDAVLARAPRALTLSPSVEYELGAKRFAVLRELAGDFYPEASHA